MATALLRKPRCIMRSPDEAHLRTKLASDLKPSKKAS
uniref:Uncharacterized protein n=1 Tax=Anguilla anguilla TaxID=7936 RepID=A0A0E9QDI7_ANGAN